MILIHTNLPSLAAFVMMELFHYQLSGVFDKSELLFSLEQRLAYAITPETEHHLVDNGEVRQFTVRVNSIILYGNLHGSAVL